MCTQREVYARNVEADKINNMEEKNRKLLFSFARKYGMMVLYKNLQFIRETGEKHGRERVLLLYRLASGLLFG